MAKAVPELKPYAVTARNSRGRVYKESFPPNVDPFAIDRQRILHAAAFRRLEYKTQVFVISEHDHFRTRLTHTLEVASIARRLCVALQVNPAVGELIALTHDVGHPPFGHAGEQTLEKLMADHGGFDHNAQALRVVELLEHPYPPFRGLNMCYEVRESLAKHSTIYDKPGAHELADGTFAPIEGQIANLADRVAYDCHDLEDAIGAGILSEEDLQQVGLWREAAEDVRRQYPDAPLPAVRRPILDRLEAMFLEDIVAESRRRIRAAKVATIDDVRQCEGPLVDFSRAMEIRVKELEKFLLESVYRHHRLVRMDSKARRIIERLFGAYIEEPRMLPPRFARRIGDMGVYRTVCDYLAGMTDRYCQDEYKRLFEPFERV
ncbi:MAG TPA: deoxyguanosinetriphosphate triphosphohydrolase [Phycisphaerae bacterium]|jgi:dGTPase|nr:deoxyguanosinetriphosphate triphosphohydrolase [Phycisphaerae bacterium]HOB73093.1 deoxyguanosinetriphosphate triphosphohydrolase [Phycisphaerae bacterium]HOJ54026.1 deoxyguanosinetriphosphate triphosphohydrolase [Phycisphaerae bacterium]HOL26437.1 deoxyguanosinetriphosphate triphosphohydrolase [Phycisphaerae bacterium]HPP20416.1 deoxyguanosinetriphosphate triphosphohydrolase [Phycisphaerae bacterium]